MFCGSVEWILIKKYYDKNYCFEGKNSPSKNNSPNSATVPSQVADVTKRKVTEGISAGHVTSHEMNLYSQHFLTNFDQN